VEIGIFSDIAISRHFVFMFLLQLILISVTTLATACHAFEIPIPVVQTSIGALAGSAGALAVYPLDFVKSQLQTETGRIMFQNGVDAAIKISLSSPVGPLALYKGALINVIGIAPEKAIKLGVNEFVRSTILATTGSLPLAGEILAGGSAGFCQVILTNPLEVVKIRMQTSEATFQNVWQDLGGLGGLYAGVSACLLRDTVFSSILFPSYAHLRVFMTDNMEMLGMGDNVFLSGILAGSCAAIPAAIIATPADVMKTRMQYMPSGDELVDDWEMRDPSTNLVTKFQILVAQEGFPVLFSGWLERIIRSVPQFGVTLATFEWLSKIAQGMDLLPHVQ
jgi:solute carrier family 25 aspartate/glutamate transporter 12/13